MDPSAKNMETNSTIEKTNSTIEKTKTLNINSAKDFAEINDILNMPNGDFNENKNKYDKISKKNGETFNTNQEMIESNSTKTKNELADLKKELPFGDLTEGLGEEEINKMFNKKNGEAIVDGE